MNRRSLDDEADAEFDAVWELCTVACGYADKWVCDPAQTADAALAHVFANQAARTAEAFYARVSRFNSPLAEDELNAESMAYYLMALSGAALLYCEHILGTSLTGSEQDSCMEWARERYAYGPLAQEPPDAASATRGEIADWYFATLMKGVVAK